LICLILASFELSALKLYLRNPCAASKAVLKFFLLFYMLLCVQLSTNRIRIGCSASANLKLIPEAVRGRVSQSLLAKQNNSAVQ